MKYKFIEAHREEFAVKLMCRVLKVSRSGYYDWRKRKPSAQDRANAKLLEAIRRIFKRSRKTYGSPRIHAELKAQGKTCGKNRVARLMRKHGIRARRPRRRVRTTNSKHSWPVAPNLLDRQFAAAAPNRKWVADLSYIDTDEGWLYLATVMDLFSRRTPAWTRVHVVGWAMADHMETSLVEQALHMALFRRRPGAGLLHHSDRGSQYASKDYRALLAAWGITVSMSRVGDCYDNAVMESFFSTLKTECASEPYATRADARTDIFEYVEVWYNRQRRHSTLGYLSPHNFEMAYALDKK
jgi:transposase InsO family protein